MWHPILIFMLVASMLAGCASLNPQPVEKVARTVPSELMLSCLPPEEPKGTVGDLLNSYVETSARLHACKARHEALSEFVKAEVKP